MKYLKEYAFWNKFWNKDSDTAEGILKSMNSLKSHEIVKSPYGRIHNPYEPDTYKFSLKGFEISVILDTMYPAPNYVVKVDNIEIDCSQNQGRKIYKRADEIFSSTETEEKDFIKKDAKIAFGKK